ncbi:MAG: hypothetical protein ACPLZ9_06895, partial [Candidatus Ratteibacteria bacterium]
TYKEDPLLNLSLDEKDYYEIGEKIASLKKKFFLVLEGGYNVLKIGNLCYQFICGILQEFKNRGE